MNEKVTRFYEAVSRDGGLQEELNVVAEGVEFSRDEAIMRRNMVEAVAAFACAHGFDLAADDLLAAALGSEGEISEAELAAVSGGVNRCNPIGMSGSVLCFGEGVDPNGGRHQCLPSGGRFAY